MKDSEKIKKLFGSQSRVDIIKMFLNNESDRLRVNQIARKTKVNKRLVSTELKKLTEIGILSMENIGSANFFQLNKTSFFIDPLKEIFSEHDWFEWERPSRIHHLVLTLDAGLKMKDYYGYSFPPAHLVFDYDNVIWYFKMSDFRQMGKHLIPVYKKNREKIWKDFHGYAATLWNHKDYASFYKNYIKFWTVAYITEFVSFYIDSFLKPDERITIQGKSFTEEYENLLWELAKEAKKKGIKNINVAPVLKNYFWIRNSYYGIHRLTEEEIRSEIQKKIGKTRIKPIAMKEPTSISENLVQIGKDMILMQDIRKKYMMKAAFYLHRHLKTVGQKYNLTPILMEQTIPSEVLNINRLMPELGEELKSRLRSCTITADDCSGIKVYSGQIFPPKGLQKKAKVEIHGQIACKGKSVGRARIVKNVNEIYKVNHGDVMISPMTSPELMPAVRRCVGIVTDFGGITCHAAIIAREFNIPCIVGTNEATSKIHDYDLVEVDANAGVVRILDK